MTSVVLVQPAPVLSRPLAGTATARFLPPLSARTAGRPGAGSATSQPATALD